MTSAANLQKALEDEYKRLQELKGNQSIVCKAYVDPTSYCNFRIKEDVFNYFGIKIPSTITDTDVVYVAKRKATTTTKKLNTVNSLKAGNIAKSEGILIGRAIKVPCSGGTGIIRKIKGALKPIKFVTIRLPASMSLAAVCLWINTCFSEASKRPTYFITQAGARVSINAGFTDKANLSNKKNA